MNALTDMPDYDELPAELPHSIEAEQALLGAILVDNLCMEKVSDFLHDTHFYEPLHARIFEAMGDIVMRGGMASPVTLKTHFEHDTAMKDVGGARYMGRLAASAVALPHARDYGRVIYDLAIRRELIRLGEDVKATAQSGVVDMPPAKQIEQAEDALFALRAGGESKRPARAIWQAGADVVRDMDARLNGEPTPLLSTGLRALDTLMGGLEPGVVTLLAGRPSMGKSALAVSIAANTAGLNFNGDFGWDWHADRKAVHFVSQEMTDKQLAHRLLSALTWKPGLGGVPYEDIRKGSLTADQVEQVRAVAPLLKDIPITVDSGANQSLAQIVQGARATARKASAEGTELGLVVIDHVGLVQDTGRFKDNRNNAVSEIIQGVTALSRDMNVPVLPLSQLSRNVESRDDKRPMLSDLRDSGSLEQDARAVLFPFREHYYEKRRKPPKGKEAYGEWAADLKMLEHRMEIDVAKLSEGQTGRVQIYCDMACNIFRDVGSSMACNIFRDVGSST